MKTISAEQARIVLDITREYGIGLEWFNPRTIYPFGMDEPAQKALDGLLEMGLAEHTGKQSRIRLTKQALEAYDRWAQGDRLNKLRRVHFKSCGGGTCSTVIVVTGPIEQAKLEQALSRDPDYLGISMV